MTLAVHIKEVCKIGQGAACCRYLMAGAKGFECEKFTPLGRYADKAVQENKFVSHGDNCAGRHGKIVDTPAESANDEPDPREFA